MFKAMFRYVKAFFLLITGQIDSARRTLSENPYVIEASYEEIIEGKKKSYQQLGDASAALIARQEEKKSRLTAAIADIAKYSKLQQGAMEKAKRLVTSVGDPEKVKKDPEYIKCQAAYRDFTSSLQEKEKYAKEMEGDIERLNKDIAERKGQLVSMKREVDKLAEEKHLAVSEIISAKEEKKIADMLAGVSTDTYSKQLQELRDMRVQARASARISKEVAGITAQTAENEFLAYAETQVVDDEFDKMIGLKVEAPKLLDPEPEVKKLGPVVENN